MEIKICGLTRPEEAGYLNRYGADYAGFVLFFEKSRRCVSIERAVEIGRELDSHIRRVAVTVSPTAEQMRRILSAGFDILQVHKALSREVLEEASIPIWYACNIQEETQLAHAEEMLGELPQSLAHKITAIVVDGAEYGSGKPFNWRKSRRLKKAGCESPPTIFERRSFVLAGGLTPENVAEGIALFEPDIVDVSSGVEGGSGKDEILVERLIKNARWSSMIKSGSERTV